MDLKEYELEIQKKKEITLCKIHPNNPLVCHSFPFVVNLSDKFFMIKENCTWMKENYENFAVEINSVEEIKDLIEEYWYALEKYADLPLSRLLLCDCSF